MMFVRLSKANIYGGESRTWISTLCADGTSCFSFAEAFSRAGSEMSAIRTLAPSLAKRIHVSSPIPLQKSTVSFSLFWNNVGFAETENSSLPSLNYEWCLWSIEKCHVNYSCSSCGFRKSIALFKWRKIRSFELTQQHQ
jgi:hypothetical protein